MERPRVGLAIIIRKEKMVLLGKRKNSHGAGEWSFPGGHLEKFETFEECAYREVNEETGLSIGLIDKHPLVFTEDFFYSNDKHYITHFVRANYLSGRIENKEQDKCERWTWFDWNHLPSPLFLPIKNLIKQNYNPFR